MRIYLAGTFGNREWRDQVVGGKVWTKVAPNRGRAHGDGSRYGMEERIRPGRSAPSVRVILKDHPLKNIHYMGPFLYEDSEGKGDDSKAHYADMRALCLEGIRESDAVLAMVDGAPDHDTIADVMYAAGLGKDIYLYVLDANSGAEILRGVAKFVISSSTPIERVGQTIAAMSANEEQPRFSNPAQETFWREWKRIGGSEYVNLYYRPKSAVYVASPDFGNIQKKVAIFLVDEGRADPVTHRSILKYEQSGFAVFKFTAREVAGDAETVFSTLKEMIG